MQPLVPGNGVLRKRLAEETDPVLRRNLAIVLRHLETERTTDYDSTMATFTEHCFLRNYNYQAYPGEVFEVIGRDNVRETYRRRRAVGTIVNYDLARIVVDAKSVLTEGECQVPLPGRMIIEAGYPVDDPEARYLIVGRLAVVWPIAEDGLIQGEDAYLAAGGFEGIGDRKLHPDEQWPPAEAR